MAIFNSKLFVYQRVPRHLQPPPVGLGLVVKLHVFATPIFQRVMCLATQEAVVRVDHELQLTLIVVNNG